VLDGLRGEEIIAELCRREGIAQSIYSKWSKEFMEAGKRRLADDTVRVARLTRWPRSALCTNNALQWSEKFGRFVFRISIQLCWIHLSTLYKFAGPLQGEDQGCRYICFTSHQICSKKWSI